MPASVLGVILLFGGLELAAGLQGGEGASQDRYVVVFTAAVAMWNMGAGSLAGLLLWHAIAGDGCGCESGRWTMTGQ